MYSRILVALDGSRWSRAGGSVAIELARRVGAELFAVHVYDAGIHSLRFQEMEPVLPKRYRKQDTLKDLRDSHGRLMFEGFEAMSHGYMEDFVERAGKMGVPVRAVRREGRNYLTLLELIREFDVHLAVLGSFGLGRIPGGEIGSTVLRVLRGADCDVLVARRRFRGKRLIVGIDGSGEALFALQRAAIWARAFDRDLDLTAVYDPFFHDQVFKIMAASFSPERQEEVGLVKQEELHEQIIDDGLGQLYRVFLEQAASQMRAAGFEAATHLQQGKAYRVLADTGKQPGVDMVVVGRFGQHREEGTALGSNSEAVVRLCRTNVLVARAAPRTQGASVSAGPPLEWDPAAEKLLEAVPAFARPMARSGVERAVRARGGDRVTENDVQELAERMGMPRLERKD